MLFTPVVLQFHTAGREKLNLAAALLFKGFPPTHTCTIMTTWSTVLYLQTLGLWDCAIENLSSSGFLDWCDGPKNKTHERTDSFFCFLNCRCYQIIFNCLILSVWEELKLFSTTHLSQEELFSQIFIVRVMLQHVGFDGSKRIWL